MFNSSFLKPQFQIQYIYTQEFQIPQHCLLTQYQDWLVLGPYKINIYFLVHSTQYIQPVQIHSIHPLGVELVYLHRGIITLQKLNSTNQYFTVQYIHIVYTIVSLIIWYIQWIHYHCLSRMILVNIPLSPKYLVLEQNSKAKQCAYHVTSLRMCLVHSYLVSKIYAV